MRFPVATALLLTLVLFFAGSIVTATNSVDFRVNDLDLVGVADQSEAHSAGAVNGNSVICWRDGRDDVTRLYYQVCDADGTPVGNNRMVVDEYSKHEAVPAMMSDGRFCIVYVTDQVFVRVYDAAGNLENGSFLVSDPSLGLSDFTQASVAVNDLGHIAVVWVATGPDGTHLWGQCLNFDGTLVGGNYRITEFSPYTEVRSAPSLAINQADRVFVTYFVDPPDELPENWDVLLRSYQYGEAPVDPEFLVHDGYKTDIFSVRPREPRLAVHSSGHAAVVWRADFDSLAAPTYYYDRGDTSFVSVFAPDGAPVAQMVPVKHDGTFEGDGFYMEIAGSTDGFVIANTVNECDQVAVFECSLDGVVSPTPTLMDVDDSAEEFVGFKFGAVNAGQVTFSWVSDAGASSDVILQAFDPAGTPVFPADVVNDDVCIEQVHPAVAVDDSGRSLILWIDFRNSIRGEIWGQILDSDGQPESENFLVWGGDALIRSLRVASNGSGRAVAVWETGMTSGLADVWLQVFAIPGFSKIGTVKNASYLGLGEREVRHSEVTVRSDNSIVLAYSRKSEVDGTMGTYFRLLTSMGYLDGDQIKVNQSAGYSVSSFDDSRHFAPHTVAYSDNTFSIIWMEADLGPTGEMALMMRPYLADGTPSGSDFPLLNDLSPYADIEPDVEKFVGVSVTDDDNFGVVWCPRNSLNMRYRYFDTAGNPQIDPVTLGRIRLDGGLLVGNGTGFLLYWGDILGSREVMAQQLSVAGELEGDQISLSLDPYDTDQKTPIAAFGGGQVVVAWEDNRESANFMDDIYARVISWESHEFGYCCGLSTGGLTGNTDCSTDGAVTLTDIVRLIDRMYVSKQPLCCEANGNADSSIDGKITLKDVTRLIDYVYVSKTPPAVCQ